MLNGLCLCVFVWETQSLRHLSVINWPFCFKIPGSPISKAQVALHLHQNWISVIALLSGHYHVQSLWNKKQSMLCGKQIYLCSFFLKRDTYSWFVSQTTIFNCPENDQADHSSIFNIKGPIVVSVKCPVVNVQVKNCYFCHHILLRLD